MSTKSNIFDNKQLIHIGAEVVVLTGLTFYFSSKNRKLMEHVEELAHKLEEQEDHIQKLEGVINNLGNLIQTRIIPSLSSIPGVTHHPPSEEKKVVPRKQRVVRKQPPRQPPQQPPHQPPQSQLPPPPPESEPEEDSDLDAEIQEELEELDEDEPHLKKQ